MKGYSENHGPVIPFGRWLNITPFLLKTCRYCISSVQKSCQYIPWGCALHVGGIWTGDISVADIEELEQMDASEIYAKRPNAKEVLCKNCDLLLGALGPSPAFCPTLTKPPYLLHRCHIPITYWVYCCRFPVFTH